MDARNCASWQARVLRTLTDVGYRKEDVTEPLAGLMNSARRPWGAYFCPRGVARYPFAHALAPRLSWRLAVANQSGFLVGPIVGGWLLEQIGFQWLLTASGFARRPLPEEKLDLELLAIRILII